MNKTWYDCSVKYRKTTENGTQKVVTDSYLVDAISFTEAESRINEEMKVYISDEFRVTNIKVTNYSEVHSSENSDRWFKSKISLLAYNEETGKEQKTNIYLLVEANDAKDAYDKTIVVMKNTMGEYSITAVSETKIIDVFPYFSKEID
jgi:hypothetical protein